MAKNIDTQSGVKPVLSLSVEGQLDEEINNKPLALDFSSNVIQVKKKSDPVSQTNEKVIPVVKMGLNFGSIFMAIIQKLWLFGYKKVKTNQFFYIEEQRKYQLENQMRKQWSQDLAYKYFIQRRDL